jgi:hypothetical protein
MAYVFDKLLSASVTPTITAGAYGAADVVGGLLTFSITSPSGAGSINNVRVVDADNEKAACKLYLFSEAPAAIADNAAFSLALADLKKLIAIIPIASADYTTIGSDAVALVRVTTGDPVAYAADGKGCLYGYLVCDATPTYTAATDLTITLTVFTQ